jgi:hypothetical protein
MKENEMGGACSTHGREDILVRNLNKKILREENTEEDVK